MHILVAVPDVGGLLQEIVEELYLRVYSRLPSADEKKVASAIFKNEKGEPTDRQKAIEDLMWALLNTPEFALNH